MQQIKVTAITRQAQARNALLRSAGSGVGAGTVRGSAASAGNLSAMYLPLTGGTLSGALSAPRIAIIGGKSTEFMKADGSRDSTAYLPLTGGTLSGNLTVRGANRRVGFLTADGTKGAAFEISANGEFVSLYPIGQSSVRLHCYVLSIAQSIRLMEGAYIYAEPGGATLRYDKDEDAWIANKAIISTSDVIAYAAQ